MSTTLFVDVERFGSIVVVGSVSVLLAALRSKLGEVTVTLLVTEAAADGSTFTTMFSAGNDAPALSVGAWVHVTTCATAVQLQPVPLKELNVRPAGNVSTTVIVLSSRSMPAAFDTVIVYVPVPPETKLPVCDFTTDRSTAGSDVALTICAMSNTRSAPAEYCVVPLVAPGVRNELMSYWSTSTP